MARRLLWIILIAVVAYAWKTYVKEGCVCHNPKRLTGKTVVITGGNAGIGKAAAIEFAKRNAHLIIASRNVEKSLAVRDEIAKETGHDDIHVMKLDLGDLDSVTEFANEILAKEKYIDYLVNNAGVLAQPGVTKQGFGSVFGINHLGPFLLTNLLLDRMKSNSSLRPVRIINLSSGAYKRGAIDWDTLADEKPVGSLRENFDVYGTSKLANIYFTSALARRVEGHNINTFSVHPGIIESELGRNMAIDSSMLIRIFHQVFSALIMRPSFYGSQTIMTCAIDDDILEFNGGYFTDCKPTALLDLATDTSVEARLWEESEKLVAPWLGRN